MSSDPHSFDPYRSPTLPQGADPGPPPIGRTGWLTVLCVLCIVLGALGIFNSLLGTVGAVAGNAMQKAFQPTIKTGGMPQDMQDAQEKFQEDLNAVQMKYFWATVPALAVRFVVALLLLIGGIRSLSLVDAGRKMLLVGCGAAIVFELAHSILQSVVSMDMMTAVNSYVLQLTETMPQNNGPDMSRVLPTIVRASVIASLVFAYVIALAKIALYIFGLIYLRKPQIIARFNANQPFAPTST